jgi:hypothetical protein
LALSLETSSASSSSHRIHPVIEGQTDYFNKNYIKTDSSSDTMAMYSIPSEYAYGSAPRQTVSITEVNQMKQTLRDRRVNTLTELRRIERVLVSLPTFMSEHLRDLEDSFGFYVSSNNFLQELRGISRQYPFSTELLEDAKSRVYHDPTSTRSWNLAWLLLVKIKAE